ncbi:MAG TPA: class I SAM-dependent methyltransferase [Bacilli bacterium]
MEAWYEKSFGKDYLLVYKHRDFQGAANEVLAMSKWLRLPAGAQVLDLCCGMGRHSLSLAALGYRVTGVDLSEVLLNEAKKLDTSGEVVWKRGDMRHVPLSGGFDAVVNLFTSFGYFANDQENIAVIAEIARMLKPGGKFIIDYLNPGTVVKNLQPRTIRQEGAATIEETRWIENGCVCKKIVLSEPETVPRTYNEQVKLYDQEWFLAAISAAGLFVEQIYGGYDGSAYREEQSRRMIFVGGKADKDRG